jgi:hypothetical protein
MRVRLSRSVCSATASLLRGSHKTLDSLFLTAGAPGTRPDLPHAEKWKDWLFAAGQDPNVDSLAVLGNVLEEFMDIGPTDAEERTEWERKRQQVVDSLEQDGLRYYRGGRVLPIGGEISEARTARTNNGPAKPASIDELLTILLKRSRQAMLSPAREWIFSFRCTGS